MRLYLQPDRTSPAQGRCMNGHKSSVGRSSKLVPMVGHFSRPLHQSILDLDSSHVSPDEQRDKRSENPAATRFLPSVAHINTSGDHLRPQPLSQNQLLTGQPLIGRQLFQKVCLGIQQPDLAVAVSLTRFGPTAMAHFRCRNAARLGIRCHLGGESPCVSMLTRSVMCSSVYSIRVMLVGQTFSLAHRVLVACQPDPAKQIPSVPNSGLGADKQ